MRSLYRFNATIDHRSLGLFRIGLGLMLLVDLALRWPHALAFYSSQGILPDAGIVGETGRWRLAFPLAWHDSPLFVYVVFTATLVFYLLFTLGMWTRVATVLTWLAFLTLRHRNPLVTIGADQVMACLLLWSIWLPLGARFSFDALRRRYRRLAKVSPARVADLPAEEDSPSSHTSLAGLAIVLQIAIIYLGTALQKTGDSWWPDGTAVYFTLHMDQSIHGFAAWLREKPLIWLQAMTWVTLVVEYAAAPLILSPWGQPWLRRLIIVALTLLHVGIAVTLKASTFSYVMIASYALLLTERDWQALVALGRRWTRAVTCYYDDSCGICERACRAVQCCDAFGRITFIGNSDSSQFRHEISVPLTERTIIVIDNETGRQEIEARGAALVSRALTPPWHIFRLMALPGCVQVANVVYRLVARNRHRISAACGWGACGLRPPESTPAAPEDVSATPTLRSHAWVAPVVAVLLLFSLVAAYNENVALPYAEQGLPQVDPGGAVSHFTGFTRTFQQWNMFAPDPPRNDGWWVLWTESEAGTRVTWPDQVAHDLDREGVPVSCSWPLPHISLWRTYLKHQFVSREREEQPRILEMRRQLFRWLAQTWISQKLLGSRAELDAERIGLTYIRQITADPGQEELPTQAVELGALDLSSQEFQASASPDVVITWYANGKKRDEGAYSENTREGVWRFWRRSGELDAIGSYQKGFKHGPWREWQENGGWEAGPYVKGQRDGEWVHYYPDGERQQVGTYRQGKREGEWEMWFPDGKLQSRSGFRQDQQHGEAVQWHAGGKVAKRGTFVNGQRHGTWQTFYASGQPALEGEFQRDRPDGPVTSWHPNGQPKEKGTYRQGQRAGTWTNWYENGQKSQEGEFRAGQQHGTWTYWHPNGQKGHEGEFRAGQKVGVWLRWNREGEEIFRQDFGGQ